MVGYHHEKYDGSGYSSGIEGGTVPIIARIFAISDVFDALGSRRPYKEPLSYDKTMEIMFKNMHFWKLYFSMMMQPGVMAHVNEDFIKLFQPMMKIMLAYFENTGSKDPMTEARLFLAVLDGVGMHYIIDPEHFPLKEVINRIKEMYIKQ